MHIMVVELDGCEVLLPATLCPTIMLLVRGEATVIPADGSEFQTERFFLRGPMMEPVKVRYTAKTLSLAVCFRPGMLQQALGLKLTDLSGVALVFADLVGAEKTQRFLHEIEQQTSIPRMAALFQDFLLDVLDHKPKSGLGAAFLAAHKKIFLPLLELTEHFGIGERQLERRVRDNFGVSLRDVRRMVRFGFSLPHILKPGLAWGDLTQIAQESAYYDQAHMHREYVELAGISPDQLRQKIASQDPAFWIYRMPSEHFVKAFLMLD